MTDFFKRLVRIAEKTDSKVVISNPETETGFVLLPLDQYEKMLDGFSKKSVKKNNVPESSLETPPVPEDFEPSVQEGGSVEQKISEAHAGAPPKEIWDVLATAPEDTEERGTWNVSELSKEERAFLRRQFRAFQRKKNQAAERVKAREEEPVVDVNDDDSGSDEGGEFSEEQFYLEPID